MNTALNFNHLDYNESRTKKATRQRILSSAYQLVVEQGIQNVTLSRILDESHVNYRNFYYYYPNIASLYEDLQIIAWKTYYELDYFKASHKTTAYERLSDLMHQFYDHVITFSDLIKFVYEYDSNYLNTQTNERLVKAMQDLQPILQTMIQKYDLLLEDGSIDFHAYSPHQTILMMVFSIFAFNQRTLMLSHHYQQRGSGMDETHLKMHMEMLLYALRS